MKKKISQTFQQFFNSEKNGSLLLFSCVILSLILANSVFADNFSALLNKVIGFSSVKYSVATWINDGLMAVFFLLVGLEIKREIITGELSTFKKASLPVLAALGGMFLPALIFYTLNKNTETENGWGIPMATDIAFALAIIAVLGKSVPASLKIFLAALAIADDLGAILVIAVFYTDVIHWNYLLMAFGAFALLLSFNFLKLKSIWIYLIVGILLWYFMHHSGIHATIAGVLLAFTIPAKSLTTHSPLEKLEHSLVKPVNFLIMPIFALANTNITIAKDMFTNLTSPLSLGIFLGLFLGKTLGVTLFSFIAVKLKLANLPTFASWKHIIGVGMLAGIGFTMSIFISMLSFEQTSHVNEAKFAILLTSVFAGIIGFTYLKSVKE